MKNKQFFLLFCSVFFFLQAVHPAYASIFDDLVNKFKKNVSPSSQGYLSMTSNITLARGGDFNKNGQIDAGDIVTFVYSITNTTKQEYRFGSIKTNIDRKKINFIHNLKGITSLKDTGNSIEIPNLRVTSSLDPMLISFDARINYIQDQDLFITTEAEVLSNDRRSITKSLKKEIKAKRIDVGKIPKTVEIEQR